MDKDNQVFTSTFVHNHSNAVLVDKTQTDESYAFVHIQEDTVNVDKGIKITGFAFIHILEIRY